MFIQQEGRVLELSRGKRIGIILCSIISLCFASWFGLYLQHKQHLIGGGISRVFLFLLINTHLVAILFLLYVIIKNSLKLFFERKKGMLGSVFKKNLLFAFILFSVIPAFFVFFTAGTFITRSIDDWFDNRFSAGLQNGLALHVQYTAQVRDDIGRYTEHVARAIASCDSLVLKSPCPNIASIIKNIQVPDIFSVALWRDDGGFFQGSLRDEVIVWRTFRTLNDRSTQSLRDAFMRKIMLCAPTGTAFDFYGSLYCARLCGNGRLLVLTYRYPAHVRSHLIVLQNALADYVHLRSMRNPLYFSYLCTFILITLLIVLLSIWCAFFMARGISLPIQQVLDAIAKVRLGQHGVQVAYNPRSDLQALVSGFNTMTRALDRAHDQLVAKNTELFVILEHVRAGVFLLNKFGRVVMCNSMAREMIKQTHNVDEYENRKISFLVPHVKKALLAVVRELLTSKKQHLSKEISLTLHDQTKIFMVHLSLISLIDQMHGKNRGLLVVLEDLTDVVRLNTLKTWQEAAKQMAHEIKNPLTPIQLATQRLQRKYQQQLGSDEIFVACTSTILNQVKILKDLTTHFFSFASLPMPVIVLTNMHELITEIVSLYQVSYPEITFSVQMHNEHVIVNTDKKKIKQVLVNLFDNSVKAIKSTAGTVRSVNNQRALIDVIVYIDTIENYLHIIVSDNGPGIAQDMKDKLFLPYVSSEKTSMGLGLAIVHDSIVQLGGTISVDPCATGAAFHIRLPL